MQFQSSHSRAVIHGVRESRVESRRRSNLRATARQLRVGTLRSVKKAVTDDTRILCICNPHSPSGTLYRQRNDFGPCRILQKKRTLSSAWTRTTSNSQKRRRHYDGGLREEVREPLRHKVSHQILRHARHTLRLRHR